MEPVEILSVIRDAGGMIEVRGDRLHIEDPQRLLADEIIQSIRESKPQLMEILKGRAIQATSDEDHFKERTSIIACAGGLPKAEAEGLAREDHPFFPVPEPEKGSPEKSEKPEVHAKTAPPLSCRDCTHFAADAINPPEGFGECRARIGIGEKALGRFPMQRGCDFFVTLQGEE